MINCTAMTINRCWTVAANKNMTSDVWDHFICEKIVKIFGWFVQSEMLRICLLVDFTVHRMWYCVRMLDLFRNC